LRFDDTNPAKEEQEYVDAIKEDLQWLGFNWAEERYASDYFNNCDWAVKMIKNGKRILTVNLQKIWLRRKVRLHNLELMVLTETVLLKKMLCSKE
jgi:hypothetical protein